MDNKKKVNVLMIIGIIFVVISGSIFVTNTWNYLSDMGKQICIMIGMIIFYTGSALALKLAKLEKTADALFYLGTAALGFLVYSVLKSETEIEFWGRFSIALSCVTFAMFAKFLFRKKFLEFIGIYLLMIILSVTYTLWADGNYSALFTVWAVLLMLLNVLHGFVEELGLTKLRTALNIVHKVQLAIVSLSVLFSITDVIHFRSLWKTIINCINPFYYLILDQDGNGFFNLVFMVAPFMLIAVWTATTIDMESKKLNFTRVLNSISLSLLVFTLLEDVNRFTKFDDAYVIFVAFAIVCIIGVALNRIEMTIMILAVSSFTAIMQVILLSEESVSYLPYLYAGAIFAVGLALRNKKNNFLELAIAQIGFQCIVYLIYANEREASFWRYFSNLIGLTLMAIATYVIFVVASFMMGKVKKILLTVGVYSFVIMINMMIPDYVYVADYLITECFVFSVAFATMFTKLIWGRNNNAINIIQNIIMAHVLAFLLMHNIWADNPHIVCAIILAITYTAYLVYGILTSRKTFFITAIVCMSIHLLYMTQNFWLSIPWWCYFMFVGLGLITTAIILELRQNKKEKDNTEQE